MHVLIDRLGTVRVRAMSNTGGRELWDRKYEEGLPSLTKPDPYFVSAYDRLVDRAFPNAGMALDLAAGLGRHSLWLADRGWQVTAVDISEVAMGKLRQAACQSDHKIRLYTMDAAKYEFGPARFDLIVLFYHLDRTLFPKIVSALNPGGWFICKMAVVWKPEIKSPRANLKHLERNEILSLVPGLQVLYHCERPVRDRGVVEFAGRMAEYPRGTPLVVVA
jgi:SAM-dependent methyltransferase